MAVPKPSIPKSPGERACYDKLVTMNAPITLDPFSYYLFTLILFLENPELIATVYDRIATQNSTDN